MSFVMGLDLRVINFLNSFVAQEEERATGQWRAVAKLRMLKGSRGVGPAGSRRPLLSESGTKYFVLDRRKVITGHKVVNIQLNAEGFHVLGSSNVSLRCDCVYHGRRHGRLQERNQVICGIGGRKLAMSAQTRAQGILRGEVQAQHSNPSYVDTKRAVRYLAAIGVPH
jgi:hypothetical protein